MLILRFFITVTQFFLAPWDSFHKVCDIWMSSQSRSIDWCYSHAQILVICRAKLVDCGLVFGKSMFYHIDSPCGFHNVILTVGFLRFSHYCANFAFLYYSQPIFLDPWDSVHKVSVSHHFFYICVWIFSVNHFFSLCVNIFGNFSISRCLPSRDLSIGTIPTPRLLLVTEKTWLTVDWILENSCLSCCLSVCFWSFQHN